MHRDIQNILQRPLSLQIFPESALLRKTCDKVSLYGEPLERLAETMLQFMRLHDGIGLAAPQVGLLRRIIVVQADNQCICLVNPVVTQGSDWGWMEEGCLSLPGRYVNITRPKNIQVKGQDVTGKSISLPAAGLLARVFQHEIDHLDGKLICDYEASDNSQD